LEEAPRKNPTRKQVKLSAFSIINIARREESFDTCKVEKLLVKDLVAENPDRRPNMAETGAKPYHP
jgi:hypothetical protein